MILFNALGIRDSGGLRVLQLELGKYNEETYPGYILVCNDSEYMRQIIEDYKHVKNFKILIHKASGYWNKDCERTIQWNDKVFDIHWPLEKLSISYPLLSDKDSNASSLEELLKKDELFL